MFSHIILDVYTYTDTASRSTEEVLQKTTRTKLRLYAAARVSVNGLKLHKFVSAAPYGVLRARPQPPAGSPGRKGPLGVRPAGLGYLLPHFGRPVARAVGGPLQRAVV